LKNEKNCRTAKTNWASRPIMLVGPSCSPPADLYRPSDWIRRPLIINPDPPSYKRNIPPPTLPYLHPSLSPAAGGAPGPGRPAPPPSSALHAVPPADPSLFLRHRPTPPLPPPLAGPSYSICGGSRGGAGSATGVAGHDTVSGLLLPHNTAARPPPSQGAAVVAGRRPTPDPVAPARLLLPMHVLPLRENHK
jgi:hypothetical protein